MSSSGKDNGDHKLDPVVSITETQTTHDLYLTRSRAYPVSLTMDSPTEPDLSKAKSQIYSVVSREKSQLSENKPFKCDRRRCVFLSLHAQEGFEPAFTGVHLDNQKEDADNLEQWQNESKEEDKENKNHPESFGEMVSRIRMSTWWLVATLLLAIPTVLSFTRYRDVHAHGVAFRGIMLWIDISWIATLAGYLVVTLISSAWDAICNLFDIIPYRHFIESVCVPITIFLATIIAWSTTPLICRLSESECSASWYYILRKVFHVSIPVTAIILLERIFMSIVVCNAGSQILQKRFATLDSYRLAIDILRAEWCRPTVKLVAHAMKAMFLCRWCCVECVFGELTKRVRRFRKHQQFLFRWKYLLIRRRSFMASTDLGLYWKGEGDDLDFRHDGQDLLTREFNKFKMFPDWRDTFYEEFVEEHIIIWDQQAPIQERRMRKEKIFELLGEESDDHTWQITRKELFATYCDVCRAFRNINKAWNGAEEASQAVNAVLTLGLLIIIALIYAAVFTGKLGSIVAPIWAAFTGVGFALSAPTGEFISCCTFVFSKHPYDVGDTIKLNDGNNGAELTVIKMYLTYTIFQQVDSGILVEIQHTQLIPQNISNLTRSKHRRIPITIDDTSTETTKNDNRIKSINEKLHCFATNKENGCRSTKAVNLESLWTDNGLKKQVHIKIEFKEDIVPLEARLLRDKQLIIGKFHELFYPKSSGNEVKSSSNKEMDTPKHKL